MAKNCEFLHKFGASWESAENKVIFILENWWLRIALQGQEMRSLVLNIPSKIQWPSS